MGARDLGGGRRRMRADDGCGWRHTGMDAVRGRRRRIWSREADEVGEDGVEASVTGNII